MNGRFKFRVWDNNEKEYIENLDIVRLTQQGKFVFNNAKNNIEPELNSKRFIFEQHTGLKDKNGKLIYEGDILGGVYGGYIGWCDKEKSFEMFTSDHECTSCSGDILWQEIVEDDGNLEVIGNIHENSDLL